MGYSLAILLPFISYLALSYWLGHTILISNGDGLPHLISEFRGKVFSIFPLRMMFVVLSKHIIMIKEIIFYSEFAQNFYHEWVLKNQTLFQNPLR